MKFVQAVFDYPLEWNKHRAPQLCWGQHVIHSATIARLSERTCQSKQLTIRLTVCRWWNFIVALHTEQETRARLCSAFSYLLSLQRETNTYAKCILVKNIEKTNNAVSDLKY